MNVTEITDLSGNPAASYRYDAFGNTLVSTGTYAAANKYRFSTKPLNDEVKNAPLYYYGYRYYDPLTGRWPSRDPIGERGGMNLYGFVGNNGVNQWDLLGMSVLSYTTTTPPTVKMWSASWEVAWKINPLPAKGGTISQTVDINISALSCSGDSEVGDKLKKSIFPEYPITEFWTLNNKGSVKIIGDKQSIDLNHDGQIAPTDTYTIPSSDWNKLKGTYGTLTINGFAQFHPEEKITFSPSRWIGVLPYISHGYNDNDITGLKSIMRQGVNHTMKIKYCYCDGLDGQSNYIKLIEPTQ